VRETIEEPERGACVCSITHGDGSNPIIQRTLRLISEMFTNVSFLYWDRLRSPPLFEVPGNVSAVAVLKGCGRRNVKVAAMLPLFWFRSVVKVLRLRPRMIYPHAFEGAVAAWSVRRIAGTPYIYHIHDNISISHRWCGIARFLLDRIEKVLVRDAQAVVLPDLCRLLPTCEGAREKVLVLPNSTGVTLHVPPLADRSDGLLTVAALGSLEVGRGIDVLLRATDGLPQVRVVAAGHIRENALAASISRQPNWDYRGVLAHKEIERVYAEADLVFLFYDPDLEINRLAVPIKFAEALSAGRPVLMNEEVRMSPRVLEWGIGYTCPYDSGALRSRLQSIAGDRSEIGQKAENAAKVYERELSWARHVSKLIEVLRSSERVSRCRLAAEPPHAEESGVSSVVD